MKKNRCIGKIYNWFAINDPRGIAPRGYRIASHYDWLNLGQNLGGSWNALNKFFSLEVIDFFSGNRNFDGMFAYLYQGVGWWTSDEANKNNHDVWALSHFLLKNENRVLWKPFDKRCGFYVRCIKQDFEKVEVVFDDDLFLQISSIVYKYNQSNTFQDLLNFLYSYILKDNVNINSYGQQWIIEKYDCERLEKIYKVNAIDDRKLFNLLLSLTSIESTRLVCKRVKTQTTR